MRKNDVLNGTSNTFFDLLPYTTFHMSTDQLIVNYTTTQQYSMYVCMLCAFVACNKTLCYVTLCHKHKILLK